jgi:hypothetical protein
MVTHFTITRERWLRGDAPDGKLSYLRDREGDQCCLGFYASACGISDEVLLERTSPDEVGGPGEADIPHQMQWLVTKDALGEGRVSSDACDELMWLNDKPFFDPVARELAIAKAFAAQGITVEFE